MTMLVSNDRQSKRALESVILSAWLGILQTETPRASDFIAQGCDAAPGPSYQEQHFRWGRSAQIRRASFGTRLVLTCRR